ncbi:hypothetical protein EPUS_05820 [Endocarpon pusillum Z07020]|uniref:DUF1746 domain-containing protein n=1 Tax=Endocarpon pusillum (strain Z07020 / HMAS-L-300199) TaxID=1263415 RepID=U1GFW7_ENDPU|nr:uncharacterized protein EPUS_05820 [Endocarpon pusillum Z07020]ERF76547.1 hypothetical protein EPUS_05820 [Endocarpon pusillum Z07020]
MSLGLYLLWVLKTLPATQGSPLPRLPPGSPIPLGNSTALNNDIAPAWMPSAQVRGTSDILYSCLLTISLSVYSAVHINVPPRGEGREWQYIQKAKWTVLGIFAPEIVVYTAIYQFHRALELQKSLTNIVKSRHDEAATKQLTDPVTTEGLAKLEENAIAEGENETKQGSAKAATSKSPLSAEFATSRAPTFSLVYCFFVGMGGFVVDVDDRDFGYKHQYVTLTAQDLEELARGGKFIEIEESEITDKSKADILAKILVCFQVMWLLVDCLAACLGRAIFDSHIQMKIIRPLALRDKCPTKIRWRVDREVPTVYARVKDIFLTLLTVILFPIWDS